MSEADEHLYRQKRVLNMSVVKEEYGLNDVEREIDSTPQIKRMMKDLDNADSHGKSEILNH